MKPIECEIINKLRTEYINLNNYKKFYFNESNGTCNNCKCKESVKHYLLDCEGNNNINYKYIRFKLWKDLRKLHSKFRYENNRTVENLLFPHIWILDPRKDCNEYWFKLQYNEQLRVKILKRICLFVLESKRFEKEEYGL